MTVEEDDDRRDDEREADGDEGERERIDAHLADLGARLSTLVEPGRQDEDTDGESRERGVSRGELEEVVREQLGDREPE